MFSKISYRQRSLNVSFTEGGPLTKKLLSQKCREAVIEMMRNLRRYQLHQVAANVREVKKDHSFLSQADTQNGDIAANILGPHFRTSIEDKSPGVEEKFSGMSRNPDILALVDSVDGTRLVLLHMPGSVVIAAGYDETRKIVTACCMGDPLTSFIWEADEDVPTTRSRTDLTRGDNISSETRVHVWDAPLSRRQSVVFFDVSDTFATDGGKRLVLNDDQMERFFIGVNRKTRTMITLCNGLNQIAVADGGFGALASVTTAKGGPWDVVGVRLVLNAGGAARAFRMNPDRHLEEVDPLDVVALDILITGNSPASVNAIADELHAAVR